MSSEARSFIERERERRRERERERERRRERERQRERRFVDLKIEILSHAGYDSSLIFNKFQCFGGSIPNEFRGTFLHRERERERERER